MENVRTYTYDGWMRLERGRRLKAPTIAYQQWGTPRADGSNVVWVCHALTASADVFDWWPGLFGKKDPFNPDDWCIVCANILGSCYGTTGPLSTDPATGKPYYIDFPELTIRDMVAAHKLLAQYLGIGDVAVAIGGSMGGQQALEWAVQEPDRFGTLVAMATNAVHSPWGVAFNEAQRMAIEADATWGAPHRDAGLAGMRAARAAALLSYRHYGAYLATQAPGEGDADFHQPAVSYQRYQGEKLARRFNAYSYHLLSRAMDSHDLGRGRGGAEKALARIAAPVLAIGISNDMLFPPEEQRRIARGAPNGTFRSIESPYGHDGFLVETQKLADVITDFLPHFQSAYAKNSPT